jgi:hypothetical protein
MVIVVSETDMNGIGKYIQESNKYFNNILLVFVNIC